MRHSKLKVGVAAAGAVAMSLGVAALPASADYAPTSKDVVGVGSDTVQYASDFIADGDFLGDSGYNSLGNKNKIINFDATPDANARLAYGPGGSGTSCSPGDGPKVGTGNQTASHADTVCTLNPTIVLRAGTSPVQRPNGSGAGASAIATDTHHYISYSRASAPQGAKLSGSATNQGSFDRLTLGTDNLAMVQAASGSNAVPLSTSQLNAIYSCTATTWTQVGGTSTDTIIPLVPQVGSGTRSTFLADIGLSAPGTCVETVEENDPTALSAATDQPGNTDATPTKDAIEPLSGGRYNMYEGKLGDGTSNGVGGYFKDPSCALNVIAAASSSSNPTCQTSQDTISPDATYTTGTPATGSANDNPNNLGIYTDTRSLFIYFRDSDLTSTKAFQSGSSLNFVRALFYNPCPDNPPVAGDGCTNDPIAGEVGPGGAPEYATAAGQSLISAAGIAPVYSVITGVTATQ